MQLTSQKVTQRKKTSRTLEALSQHPAAARLSVRIRSRYPGLLLRCNVVVRENKDGEVTAAFTAPEALMALVNRRDISNLATDVRRRLERVRDQVVIRTERAA